MKDCSEIGIGCLSAGFVGLIGYLLFFMTIGLVCFAPLEYTCEYWGSYAKKQTVDLPAKYVYVAACIPPIAAIGVVGGAVTLLVSSEVENPWYIPN